MPDSRAPQAPLCQHMRGSVRICVLYFGGALSQDHLQRQQGLVGIIRPPLQGPHTRMPRRMQGSMHGKGQATSPGCCTIT